MKVENFWRQVEEMWGDAKEVVRLKMQLTKMEYLDRVAYMCAQLFFLCLMSLFLLLFLFTVAASLGAYVAEWLGSWSLGLATSSLFLIITIIVACQKRDRFFIKPANRYFLRMFTGYSSRRRYHTERNRKENSQEKKI